MKNEIVKEYLICPSCHKPKFESHVFEGSAGEIENGLLECRACKIFYRVEDGLVELLVPRLRDASRYQKFLTRFKTDISGLAGISVPTAIKAEAGDEHKLGQKSFYDEDSLAYETHMLRLPFWKAFDQTYLDAIRQIKKPNDIMLEIGCGTGRISLPTSGNFKAVLGFDISEAMVRTAMEKRKVAGLQKTGTIHYFVADAENIPVRPSKIDLVIFSGILHHVESPHIVIERAAQCLKPGGRFIGLENNRSFFRPAFDLLMKIRELWNEKAHEEHFIMSKAELNKWLGNAGLEGNVWTSVFLPPHLFNVFRVGPAKKIMQTSDAICRAVPWLRYQGGLVLFSGEKSQ